MSRSSRASALLATLLAALLPACGGGGGEGAADAGPPDADPRFEHPVLDLPLAGPITAQEIQLSGLAWHGDDLILMPEVADEIDAVYALPKAALLAAVAGDATPLTPRAIPLDATGLAAAAGGLEGLEAIAIDGDAITFALEARAVDGSPIGYVVAGAFVDAGARIVIDPATVVRVDAISTVPNHANEALVGRPGAGVLVLSEVNGLAVVPQSRARAYGPAPGLVQSADLAFPRLEYRVTDATPVDAAGRFWVMNYFFPDETVLLPAEDPLATRYGEGPTHQGFAAVERLVELQVFDDAVELVDAPPIQLELVADGADSRNWEGLARLDDQGFLMVTDAFPRTMLGFVAR